MYLWNKKNICQENTIQIISKTIKLRIKHFSGLTVMKHFIEYSRSYSKILLSISSFLSCFTNLCNRFCIIVGVAALGITEVGTVTWGWCSCNVAITGDRLPLFGIRISGQVVDAELRMDHVGCRLRMVKYSLRTASYWKSQGNVYTILGLQYLYLSSVDSSNNQACWVVHSSKSRGHLSMSFTNLITVQIVLTIVWNIVTFLKKWHFK